MKAHLEGTAEAAETVESLRLELERCQRELDTWRERTGELEQGETLLAGENRLLEMVAKGESLPLTLDGICRLVDEVSTGSLCSILLLDPNDNRLRHGAAPGLPASYISAFGGKAIGPKTGPRGRAIYFRKPIIVCDIATDPLGGEYRDLALTHGLRACWSTPILSSEGKALGSFAVLAREPRSPTLQHQRLIAQITHLAAVAIERKHTEEEFRRSEAYLAEAQKLSLTGSFGWKVITGELIWSDGTFCIMGYDRSVKPTLELVFRRVHPDDLTLVQQTLDFATRNQTGLDFEHRLLMPDEAVKHVHVVARATKAESGAIEFVGALMDITERKHAAETLRASEKLARSQVEALTRTLDALAMESVPDRLVEHVLQTITKQLGAHSCSVWQRDEASGVIDFQFSFEDGRFVTKSDSVLAGISLKLPMEEFWPWPTVFRTGKPGLMEDIREFPFFPWQERLISLGVITILIVPMSLAARVDAVIGVRFTQKRVFSPDELDLAQALANQAMLAMQLTRLSVQSRDSAVIAERNRMARDMHDTLAQSFTGVIMQLEAAKGAIAQKDVAEATERVERAGDLARVGLGEARRSVMALRPRSLQNTSLCMALDDLLKRMTNGSGLQAEFHLEGNESKMPAEWEDGLLRIAQESLTNTIKHAKAKNFRATLTMGAKEIQFRVVDDGSGFDLQAENEGFGLLGMKERVDQMGGEFILRSMPGQGTEIQILLRNEAKPKPNDGGENA
jgi:signal transduction histidine kinase